MTCADLRHAIATEATTWLGTPFHYAAAIKGAGVDCFTLALAVYNKVGVMASYVPLHPPPDWFLHRSDELIVREFRDKWGLFEVASPQMGDIALIQFGRSFSHIAIMLDAVRCIHACNRSQQVMVADLTDQEFLNRNIKYFSRWQN